MKKMMNKVTHKANMLAMKARMALANPRGEGFVDTAIKILMAVVIGALVLAGLYKKYGVWAVRSAASVCGAAQSWCKQGGKPMEFDMMEQAVEYADQLNKNLATMNVHYYPKEMEPKLSQGSGFSMRM